MEAWRAANRWSEDHWIVFTIGGSVLLGMLSGLLFSPWRGLATGLIWLGVGIPMGYFKRR